MYAIRKETAKTLWHECPCDILQSLLTAFSERILSTAMPCFSWQERHSAVDYVKCP